MDGETDGWEFLSMLQDFVSYKDTDAATATAAAAATAVPLPYDTSLSSKEQGMGNAELKMALGD